MISAWLTKVLGPNWKTTLSGILAGFPPIIIASAAGSGVPLPAWALMTLSIMTGVGALLTGVFAKDKNVTGGSVSQNTNSPANGASKPPTP